MHINLNLSVIIELHFFLGLQIKQTKEEIFLNQAKYTKKLFKRFGLDDS